MGIGYRSHELYNDDCHVGKPQHILHAIFLMTNQRHLLSTSVKD